MLFLFLIEYLMLSGGRELSGVVYVLSKLFIIIIE